MQNQFSRTQLLVGRAAIDTLAGSRVAIFGIGGVGGYVVEVLARSGVGEMDLFDDDRVCLTNVNRQILATISTVGQHKVDVAEKRIHDINPRCIVHKYQMFYLPTNADKIDATAFQVCDINKTRMDPLAKVMRKKLRKMHINHLKVVYSPEEPLDPIDDADISCRFHCICPNKDMRKCTDRRNIPASNAFVPAAAGLIVGGEVVKDLIAAAHTFRILPDELADNPYAQKAKEKADEHLKKFRELRLRQQKED